MKKFKWIAALLIFLSVLILIGIGLMAYFMFNPTKGTEMIRLDLEHDVRKIVDFTDLTLVPGEESKYSLILTSAYEDDYDISLHFSETEDRLLKEYAYVRIECGDEVLCDKRLSEVLDGDPIAFKHRLSSETDCEVVVSYYLPIEIGNEAEGTAAEFSLMIVATNEGDFYE